jgi:N-acetylmuramic acid 6-phosphate etherase
LETITYLRVADDNYLDARLTERRNPRTATIDTASALEIVDLIGAEDATVPAAVARAREDIARAVDLIEQAFRAGGRLIYVGAGTSGRLGVLDAAECPPTFGTPPEMVVGVSAGGYPALVKSVEGAEDDVNAAIGEMDARRVGPDDVVVGIAASGTTPFVRAALSRAQTLGARTAIVTCSEPPKLLRDTCDATILVLVGPEVVTGSTRMKAGTATKLVLNSLTTAAMIRLGKTYGNLMVDLRAWNDKLIDRSERIVMETTGLPRTEARGVIDAADGKVKTAIVMARRRVSRDEAERLLEEHEGRLRSIVGDPPPVRGA